MITTIKKRATVLIKKTTKMTQQLTARLPKKPLGRLSKRMLSKKKAVIAFAVLLLGIGIFASIALAIDPSLDGLTIRTGTGPTSDASSGSTLPPASLTSPPLAPGEVRTSKSIVYNTEAGEPDGTITVTLSAWARPYLVDGVTTNPLTAMAGGVFVEIVDDIGEFIVEGPLPAGLSQSGTQLTWNITDQTSILGPAPLTLSYTLTVASPANQPYDMRYWYATGEAVASFVPTEGNPYYWGVAETLYDEFTLSMIWNNGNGLNQGAITDNVQNVTIVFPTNQSTTAGLKAYNSDGSMNLAGRWNWWPQNVNTRNQAAMVTTGGVTYYYSWHLEWSKGASAPNVFTVKDFDGPGLDVQFTIQWAGPGGSEAVPGGRTIVGHTDFQRSINTGPNDRFEWDGEKIVTGLHVIGEIQLTDDRVRPEFELNIAKSFGVDDFHDRWGMTDDTLFTLQIMETITGFYLVFVDEGSGLYTFDGFAAEGTPITFSVNRPAVLTGIPTNDAVTIEHFYSVAEYFPWDPDNPHAPNVSVAFSVDGGAPQTSIVLDPMPGDQTDLVVINTFEDPAFGVMEVLKLLDGFAMDWGVTLATEFTFKIWDANPCPLGTNTYGENYLLWVEVDQQAIDDGWTSPGWVPGTLYCVGNDGNGITNMNDWNWSDDYWRDRALIEGNVDVMLELPIYSLEVIRLSNLWPGPYEIHELDFEGNILATSPASAWWWANYYFGADQGAVPGQGIVPPAGTLTGIMTNYFDHGEANLALYKELLGFPEEWGVDEDTEFIIRLKDMTNESFLLFDPVPEDDGTLRHVGFIDASNVRTLEDTSWTGNLNTAIYELLISVNSPVVLSNIYSGEGHHYLVEELNPDGHTVRLFTGTEEFTAETGGIIVTPFEDRNITIVNHYLHKEEGRAIIFKEIEGDYEFFGVDEDTEFTGTAINAETGRTVLSTKNADIVLPFLMSSYTYVGELDEDTGIVYLLQRSAGESTWSFIPSGPLSAHPGLHTNFVVSVNKPVMFDGLVPGNYQITEVVDPDGGYYPTLVNAGAIAIEDAAAVGVTILNTFVQPIPDPTFGSLAINKELLGFPDDWGIDEDTSFDLRVLDLDNERMLLFHPVLLPDGSYLNVGHAALDGSDPVITLDGYTGIPISLLSVSVNTPLLLSNIPSDGDIEYAIEELSTAGVFSVRFFADEHDISGAGPLSEPFFIHPNETTDVTIVNAFLHHGDGRVYIDKELDGLWEQSQIDLDTQFGLTLTNDATGNTLLFELLSQTATTTVYRFFGEVDDSDQLYGVEWDAFTGLPSLVPVTGTIASRGLVTELVFSANRSIEILELIPGDYQITEDYGTPPEGIVVEYTISDPIHLEADNALGITVTNTYLLDGSLDPDDGPGPHLPPDGGRPGDLPHTGDANNLMFWVALLLAAVMNIAIIALTQISKRKTQAKPAPSG